MPCTRPPTNADRVVIVGAGFAGFTAARELQKTRAARRHHVDQPDRLLPVPPVAARGRRRDPGAAPHLRVVARPATERDAGAWYGHRHRRRRTRGPVGRPRGTARATEFDRLVLAAGSVNKLLPIPGVAEHAHGFRGISEALYLRDHITRQLELAAATTDADEREARCTFVVVGAGYTGTEVAAQGQLFTARLARQLPALRDQRMRWLLADLSDRLLPGLSERMSRTAERVLRRRGLEIRLGDIDRACRAGLRAHDDRRGDLHPVADLVRRRARGPTRRGLSLPTDRGRLQVRRDARGPGPRARVRLRRLRCGARCHATRCGDRNDRAARAAAGQARRPERRRLARRQDLEPYKHHDLGFLVDLGGGKAAANPLHIPLSGLAAKTVTRGYHLLSLPGNRSRTATDWALNTIMPPRAVQLGLVDAGRVPLDCTSPAHRSLISDESTRPIRTAAVR